jgi:hypothetical protein
MKNPSYNQKSTKFFLVSYDEWYQIFNILVLMIYLFYVRNDLTKF